MSNELAILSYDEIEKAALAMSKSGYFQDAREQSQAIVKILAGREMGFGPFASMTGVYIISGRPSIGANLMASAVKRSGRYDYRVREMTDAVCEIEYLQAGKSIGISRFTIEDARKAGTKNTDKYPRNMLFARAMSNGVRWYCPDVFDGAAVYTPEELGANVNEQGEVIDAQIIEAKHAPVVSIPSAQIIDGKQTPSTTVSTPAPIIYEPAQKNITPEDETQPITQSHTGEDYASMTVPQLAGRHAHYSKLSRDASQPADVIEQAKKTADYIAKLITEKRAAK